MVDVALVNSISHVSGKAARMHHVDWLRAFFIVMGVPYHAALIYAAGSAWFVSSPDRSMLFTGIAGIINAFRMPGFFLISGMMSYLTLMKYGRREWIFDRANRILVPLVTATILIAPISIYAGHVAASGGSLSAGWLQSRYDLMHFGNHWVGHLWFLYALAAFCAILFAVAPRIEGAANLFAKLSFNNSINIVIFMLVYQICIRSCTYLFEKTTGSSLMIFGFVNLEAWLIYAPYFFFGVIYQRNSLLIQFTGRFWIIAVVLATVACVITFNQPGLTKKLVWYCSTAVLSVVIPIKLYHLAEERLIAPSKLVTQIVDSAFTIYLLHMPVICLLGAVLIASDFPIAAEFTILVIMGGVVSFAIHQTMRRSRVILWLFNGKPMKARQKIGTS